MSTELLFQQLERECRSNGNRNVLTALKSIKKYGVVTDVKALFDDEKLILLKNKISREMKVAGKKESTISSVRSNLVKLVSLARKVAKPDTLPKTLETKTLKELSFGNALKEAFSHAYPQKSVHFCAKEIDKALKYTDYAVKKGTLLDWIYRDITPKHTSLKSVHAIEALLNISDGALSNKVKLVPVKTIHKGTKPQCVLFDFPEKLAEQIDDMMTFYKSGDIPACRPVSLAAGDANMLLQGGSKWKTKKCHKQGIEISQTETGYRNTLKHFFSWLTHEHKVPLESLDLSILFYDKLYPHYLTYLSKNNRGLTQVDDLIKYTLAGMRDGSRYLARYHIPTASIEHDSPLIRAQYPDGLPAYKSYEEWAKVQQTIITNLDFVARDATKKFNRQKSSGTKEQTGGKSNIKWMLSYDKGVVGAVDDVLWPTIEYLGMNLGGNNLSNNQVAAWLALELVTPLRITNTLELQLIDDKHVDVARLFQPTCWFDIKGDFRVFVPLQLIKNGSEEILTSLDDVDVKIPKGNKYFKLIKQYINSRSAALKQKNIKSEFLFCGVSDHLGEPMLRKGFGTKIKNVTYQTFIHILGETKCKELGITQGLNPHSLRHIVAQYLLELYIGDYALVAHVLMDSVETIIKEYGSNNHANQRIKYHGVMFG